MQTSNPTHIEQTLRSMQRQLNLMRAALVIAGLVATGAWFSGASTAGAEDTKNDRILRVRGLIVEDDKGRSRIVLGAPVPQLPDRKRKDATTTMVFLGEDGADRMCMGFTPDPQMKGRIAKRVAPSVGVQINDPAGNERTGYGYLENGRVNLGIDWPNREAIVIGIDDKDGSAIMQMWGEKDNTAERAGFYVGRDGTSLMKVSNEKGFERFVLQTQGEEAARFLISDLKEKKFNDVLPRLTNKP